MPTMGALSEPLSEPSFAADPKAPTVPLASASQYPLPLGRGAIPMVREFDATAVDAWAHEAVMSEGVWHELTKMAAREPPL